MEVIRLSPEDCALLDIRSTEYDNSQRQMEAALMEADPEATAGTEGTPAPTSLARLRALRALEHRFTIDLGSLYYRFQRREEPTLHPLERRILDSIACWRETEEGDLELWVFVDRVRELRRLLDEERIHWLEPASGEGR